jgi:hypothetical protein
MTYMVRAKMSSIASRRSNSAKLQDLCSIFVANKTHEGAEVVSNLHRHSNLLQSCDSFTIERLVKRALLFYHIQTLPTSSSR